MMNIRYDNMINDMIKSIWSHFIVALKQLFDDRTRDTSRSYVVVVHSENDPIFRYIFNKLYYEWWHPLDSMKQ